METEIPLLNDDQGNCWQIKYLKNNSHANKTGINSNVDDDDEHDDNDHDYDEKKPKNTQNHSGNIKHSYKTISHKIINK